MKRYFAQGKFDVLQDIIPDIHIWSANLDVSCAELSGYYKYLSARERKRMENLKFEKDKNHYVAFRGILRKILSIYTNVPPEAILIRYNDFGKPILQDHADYLYFNSSRSNHLALYIFSGLYEVGIDIEKVKDIGNIKDIILQFFAAEEISDFKKLPPQKLVKTFYKTWTKKEAFIKAIGEGLSFPLNQFQVSIAPTERCKIVQINGKHCADAAKWSVNEITMFPGYEAAYVYQGHNANVKFLTFN